MPLIADEGPSRRSTVVFVWSNKGATKSEIALAVPEHTDELVQVDCRGCLPLWLPFLRTGWRIYAMPDKT
ncbi:hypothetical protein C0030_003575 [Candidatus Liberibacter solanacearum]|uniref:Uncharacterized protein n=1 Tax=Candidatus Liberibacter solanacearum TaxID=556287 RepID=A0A3R7QU62_9HYPH|nr:hypothetical protein C0030_003575 [Candidatus Liberibacter solanacearum]